MNGCGAEKCERVFSANSFRGLTINSFFAYNVGSSNVNKPTEYLFDFKHGLDATLSGLYFLNDKDSERYYNYKLGVSGSGYGYENITVTDGSLSRDEIYFVSNYKYNRPIKLLRGDETSKDETINTSVDKLYTVLDKYEYMTINHTITINVEDGTEPTRDFKLLLRGLTGSGKIIIQGNSVDRGLVILNGGYQRFTIKDISCLVEFRNLTIKNTLYNGYSDILTVNNCSRVIMNNVAFSSGDRSTGAAIKATNNSNIHLIGGSEAVGTGFGSGGISDIFDVDETSTIHGQTN